MQPFFFVFHFIALGCCAPVLPYNGRIYRFSGLSVPYHGGFPLIHQANTGNVIAFLVTERQGFFHSVQRGLPDIFRIVLDPTGFRIMLGVLFLCREDR